MEASNAADRGRIRIDLEAKVGEAARADLVGEPVPLECELEAMARVVVEDSRGACAGPDQVAVKVFFSDRELAARTLEVVRVELLGDLSVLLEEALLRGLPR